MKIIESPREGLQSVHQVVPANEKIRYINQLLRVGFDTIEAGSIVSPKLIPQLADTREVIMGLDTEGSRSRIMVLVGSPKGAEMACEIPGITHISYPFSVSATFLKQNLNVSPGQSLSDLGRIINRCSVSGKEAVIYISMAFGNPYGDPWNEELLAEAVEQLAGLGAEIIPLSNVAVEIDDPVIRKIFSLLVPSFPGIEFGLHLHTSSDGIAAKLSAAWESGCRRYDSVIGGHGGCPMSGREMLGNLKTEDLLAFAITRSADTGIVADEFRNASGISTEIFARLI